MDDCENCLYYKQKIQMMFEIADVKAEITRKQFQDMKDTFHRMMVSHPVKELEKLQPVTTPVTPEAPKRGKAGRPPGSKNLTAEQKIEILKKKKECRIVNYDDSLQNVDDKIKYLQGMNL
jgi:hypothetical protein